MHAHPHPQASQPSQCFITRGSIVHTLRGGGGGRPPPAPLGLLSTPATAPRFVLVQSQRREDVFRGAGRKEEGKRGLASKVSREATSSCVPRARSAMKNPPERGFLPPEDRTPRDAQALPRSCPNALTHRRPADANFARSSN